MANLRLKYNPSHMPEDELVRSFVVRQRDLAAILETVTENTGASNQHLLILGPRGMGKTTLVNRAVAEIRRDPALGQLWYPILFDEESYTVTSAGELWFQALVHLADQTRSPTLEQARRALQPITDRTRLRDASLARLLEFAASQHKRLLLVFENIDMIFDAQMTEADGWDVRHTLQNEPRIMVLATSPTRLESFHDSRKPLYELFHEHTLERLDLEECRAVWRLVADRDLPLHQARPIQIFTGGNTRLLTILATFARDRSFRELMDDLVGLIDENTSYFKANIEALPPESRKVFVTLADLWSPATSRQVADQTRGDIRAVSAQLGRLVDQGIVEVVRRVDRTQMFQVAERMYNLYYLLRRRGSGRVRALVEFIVRYYDDDGASRLLTSLARASYQLGDILAHPGIHAETEHALRRAALAGNIDPALTTMARAMMASDLAGARAAAHVNLTRDLDGPAPRLQQLCSFVLDASFAPLYPDVLAWAQRLAQLPPNLALANLFIARVEARCDRWTRTWGPLAITLEHPAIAAANLREIVTLLSLAAARGHTIHALPVLALSPSAPHFEPLLVALRRLADQATHPPQEVSEVADDIVRDIERLRHAIANAPAPAPPNLSRGTHQQHRKTPRRGRATPNR